jgi:hypothetical protein
MKKMIIIPFIALLAMLGGCNTIPKGTLKIAPEALELRQTQQKNFSIEDAKIMQAAVGVLQDLGYTIKDSESGLGLLVGEKDRDASTAGGIALSVLGAMFGARIPFDKQQKIKLSLVVSPTTVHSKNEYRARIAIQRLVWNSDGHVRAETITDAKIYEEFFEKLAKAVFLEKNV